MLLFLHSIKLDKIDFRETGMVSVYVIFALLADCHIMSVVNIKTQTLKQCCQQGGFNYVQISTDTCSFHNTFSTQVSATQQTYVLH